MILPIGFEVGSNIRRKRQYKDYTQKELANKVGISQSYISQIENGNMPPRELLVKIASVLDEPLNYFWH